MKQWAIPVYGDEIPTYGFDLWVERQLNPLMEAMGTPVTFSVERIEIRDKFVNPGALLMTDYRLIACIPEQKTEEAA